MNYVFVLLFQLFWSKERCVLSFKFWSTLQFIWIETCKLNVPDTGIQKGAPFTPPRITIFVRAHGDTETSRHTHIHEVILKSHCSRFENLQLSRRLTLSLHWLIVAGARGTSIIACGIASPTFISLIYEYMWRELA